MIEAAGLMHPDVLVVDVAMPRLNGIEAVRRLCPSTLPAIVFFSSHGDASLMEQAFAAGGLGYVLKGSAAEDLPLAIRAALRGETFVSPSLK
jgi:DNA-binding NarL/FixJ family response regulator